MPFFDELIEEITKLGNQLPPNSSTQNLTPVSQSYINAVKSLAKLAIESQKEDKIIPPVLKTFLYIMLPQWIRAAKDLPEMGDKINLVAQDLSGKFEGLSRVIEHFIPDCQTSFRNKGQNNLLPRIILEKEYTERVEHYQGLIEEKIQEIFRSAPNEELPQGFSRDTHDIINACISLGNSLLPNRDPLRPLNPTEVNDGTRQFGKSVINLAKNPEIPTFLRPFLNFCTQEVIIQTKTILSGTENPEECANLESEINALLEIVSRILEQSLRPRIFYRRVAWNQFDRQKQLKNFIQHLQLLIKNYEVRKKNLEKELVPANATNSVKNKSSLYAANRNSGIRYTNKELLELLLSGNKETFNLMIKKIPNEKDRETTKAEVTNLLRRYIEYMKAKKEVEQQEKSSSHSEGSEILSQSEPHLTSNESNIERVTQSAPITPVSNLNDSSGSTTLFYPSQSSPKSSNSPAIDSPKSSSPKIPLRDKSSDEFSSPSLAVNSSLNTVGSEKTNEIPSFFGAISKTEAETILSHCSRDSFLIRSSSQGGYAVSLIDAQTKQVGHLLIIQTPEDSSKWKIKGSSQDTRIYDTISQVLVESPLIQGFTGLEPSECQEALQKTGVHNNTLQPPQRPAPLPPKKIGSSLNYSTQSFDLKKPFKSQSFEENHPTADIDMSKNNSSHSATKTSEKDEPENTNNNNNREGLIRTESSPQITPSKKTGPSPNQTLKRTDRIISGLGKLSTKSSPTSSESTSPRATKSHDEVEFLLNEALSVAPNSQFSLYEDISANTEHQKNESPSAKTRLDQKTKSFMDTFSRGAATLSGKLKVRTKIPVWYLTDRTRTSATRKSISHQSELPGLNLKSSQMIANQNPSLIKEPDAVLISVLDTASGLSTDLQISSHSRFSDVLSIACKKLDIASGNLTPRREKLGIYVDDKWVDLSRSIASLKGDSKKFSIDLKERKSLTEKVKITVLGISDKTKPPIVDLKIFEDTAGWVVFQKIIRQLLSQKLKIVPFFYTLQAGKTIIENNDLVMDVKHFKDLTFAPIKPKSQIDLQIHYNGTNYKLSVEPTLSVRSTIQLFIASFLITYEQKGLIESDAFGLVNLGKFNQTRSFRSESIDEDVRVFEDEWEEPVETWIDPTTPVSDIAKFQNEIRKRTHPFQIKILDGPNEHEIPMTLDLYRPLSFVRDILTANFVFETTDMSFFTPEGTHLPLQKYILTCIGSKSSTLILKKSFQRYQILIEHIGFIEVQADIDTDITTLNSQFAKFLQQPDLDPSDWSLYSGFNGQPLDSKANLCEQYSGLNNNLLIFRYKKEPTDPAPPFPEFNTNIWDEPTSSANAKFNKKDFRAGTINQCIIHLTNPYNSDKSWKFGFLASSSDLLTPKQLFEKLKQRYEIPSKFRERSQELSADIQKDVLKVLTYWIQEQPFDFSNELWIDIQKFASSLTPQNSQLNSAIRNRISVIHAKVTPSESPNAPPIILQLNKTDSGILAFHHLEIARQLTIIDFELFSNIPIRELRNQAWLQEELSQHMKKFSMNSNAISSWVSSAILNPTRAKDRAHRWQKFIKIAEKLRDLNNFSSLMGIIGGWNNPAITRLNFTKELISKSYLSLMESLESEMSPSFAFKEYREAVLLCSDALVPHLPIHLQDLTFIEQGNPSSINGLFNSERRTLTFKTLSWIRQTQKNPYNLRIFPQLRSFLLLHEAPHDEKEFHDGLYNISREREPRGATKVL